LAVLGLPAVLDGQNVRAVQLKMAIKRALSFNTFIDNNFVIFFNVSGRPWWSWGCQLFWMHKIQYTHCTIMLSLSSMFLGGLGGLGAAGCLGWTKSDRSSMRNGNKKCFVSQPTHFFLCCFFLSSEFS
jgi:hypothetical protein